MMRLPSITSTSTASLSTSDGHLKSPNIAVFVACRSPGGPHELTYVDQDTFEAIF